MKKIDIPCDFNGEMINFPLYVGEPDDDLHPLHFQSEWLTAARSGKVPQQVMESFKKLQDIAKENNVPFEDLCVYALGNNNDNKEESQ